MLSPHAFHDLTIKAKSNRKDTGKIHWCEDCQVRCWDLGEDIGHYFDYKDRSIYIDTNCKIYIAIMITAFGHKPKIQKIIKEFKKRLEDVSYDRTTEHQKH